MIVKEVKARKIKDSRNEETIEVRVNGCRASAPSGKSKGKYESRSYYRGINFCIKFLNNWKDEIEINSFEDLKKIEDEIKKKLKLKDIKSFGGNSLFAFESAILKALAKSQKKELWQIINPDARILPIPIGNCIGGGLHSHRNKKPAFQEFLLIPDKSSFKENYYLMRKIYFDIGKKIKSNKRNDEGAWETELNEENILEILNESNIKVGVDIAASTFYKKGKYNNLSRENFIKKINGLIQKYNLFYVEDPLDEEDFRGYSFLKGNLIVGDDLTATRLQRIKKAMKRGVNAIIVKPNQNGSLLEVKEIIEFCKKNNLKTILSHRSGETKDNALSDYAFGFQTDFIKSGIYGKVRRVKLKRLIRIEKNFA